VLVVFAVSALPAAAAAPDPQKLWQAYPLDAGGQRPAPTPTPKKAATARPHPPAATPTPTTAVGWPLYALIAVAAIATLAVAAMRLLGVGTPTVSSLRGRSLPHVPKLPRPSARREHQQVPRAPTTSVKTVAAASDAATALKLKQHAARDEARRDDDVLKAKLAQAPPPVKSQTAAKAKVAVAATNAVAPVRAVPAPPVREQPVRAAAPAASPAPLPARRPARQPEGRIEWWRGYTTSEFQAILRTADDARSLVMRSESFRWRKSTPPPSDVAQIADAHAALVTELRAAGWAVSDDGDEWYAFSFRSRTKGDA
jgi:hypothetical protein